MAKDFTPWTYVASDPEPTRASSQTETQKSTPSEPLTVRHQTRIAVVDDPSAAPRVLVVEPAPIRDYLEEITQTTYRLAKEQGGRIPFMVIREVVENLIHAYFTDPVITILPGGDTLRFSDRGPGIAHKTQALEYGTTTATEAMKRYIRGVGSGLPYVRHFLDEKGGSLTIEDNLETGTVVTMSLVSSQNPLQTEVFANSMGFMNSANSHLNEPSPTAQETTPLTTRQLSTNAAPLSFDPARNLTPILPLESTPVSPALTQKKDASSPATSPQGRLSPAERQIFEYLARHGSVGPTDLQRVYGGSLPTWSRRLSALEVQGFVEKRGQKRYPTELGAYLMGL